MTLMAAIAHTESVRKIVTQEQQQVLLKHLFPVVPEYNDLAERKKVVLGMKDSYLPDETNRNIFLTEMETFYNANAL